MNLRNRTLSSLLFVLALLAGPPVAAAGGEGQPAAPREEEIAALQKQVAAQQSQIDELRRVLEEQSRVLARLAGSASVAAAAPSGTVPSSSAMVVNAVAPPPPQTAVAKAPEPPKPAGTSAPGGFQLSGDFRLRADVQARSGNAAAGPLQNVRGRYRVRLNVEKELDPRFKFRLQLSTGPLQNAITNDQDMAGMVAKHPFSIAEAWMDFHPTQDFSIRGGRMEEVFADNMRFLWDDDVRFNGFQQVVRANLGANPLGFTNLELRAGQYILSNPAVYVLPANSPFLAAGYKQGQKVRSSNLFHPGFVLRGRIDPDWSHQLFGGVELYRNPDQIQLASTATGFPVLINNTIGLVLSGPQTGTGNATTAPGGAMYSARDFQIPHLGYRLERRGVRIGNREMPAWVDLQASRNVGTSRARDAYMVSGNLGAVRQAGDLRFLYQFAVKDANSMISQFTDDDLGTGSGVNITVHALRFDVGVTRFLQFQNLLFLQRQREGSDPAGQFFVPLGRGANRTVRYLGQLAFAF